MVFKFSVELNFTSKEEVSVLRCYGDLMKISGDVPVGCLPKAPGSQLKCLGRRIHRLVLVHGEVVPEHHAAVQGLRRQLLDDALKLHELVMKRTIPRINPCLVLLK